MWVSSVGDCGDVIFLLNLLKHILGGPHSLGIRHSTMTKAKTADKAVLLFKLLEPLVAQQDYIKEFKILDANDKIDWESEDFRRLKHFTEGETLMQAHLNHYNMVKQSRLKVTGSTPWLKVKLSKESKGRVVVNLTERYRNASFPWQKIADHYRDLILFVGLEHEHHYFCRDYGKVEHVKTDNLLQVAELIAGSELFIGNQSSAGAIAEGLKHRRIQETSLVFPDCVFPQAAGLPEVQHVANGEVVLPAIGNRPALSLASSDPVFKPLDLTTSPPGFWQYPGAKKNLSINPVASEVVKLTGVSFQQAREMVYEYQCVRLPEFFAAETAHLERFKRAKQNAG